MNQELKRSEIWTTLARFYEQNCPDLYKATYPRKINSPNSDKYAHPKYYALTQTAILWLGRSSNYNSRDASLAGMELTARRSVQLGVPTFFIGEDFLRALMASDLSPDFEFKHLRWPFDAMTFCLPLTVMREHFPVPVPWITIARIPAGEHTIGVNYRVEFKEDRIGYHYPVFAAQMAESPQDFGGIWPLSGEVQKFITSKPIFDDVLSTQLSGRPSILTPEQDNEICRKVTVLSILITLGMIARPELVEMGGQLRKEKVVANRPDKSYDAIWNGNVVGFKYGRKNPSTGQGSGITRRFWKRRGHLRNQIYGKMFDEKHERIPAEDRPHQVIWIEPVTNDE